MPDSGAVASSPTMRLARSRESYGHWPLSRLGELAGLLVIHELPGISRQRPGMPQKNRDEALPGPENRPDLAAQDELWGEVMKLGSTVESMLHQAVEVLCEGRPDLAAEVRDQERNVDGWEVRIEEMCLRALALYGPVASDLRRTVSALGLLAHLERVGDLATKIAKRSVRFFEDPSAPPIPASLVVLAIAVTDTFSKVIAALSSYDVASGRAIITSEEEIDRQCQMVVKELKDSLRHQPEQVTAWLRLMNSARNLERIGDHAVNIAEAIVYIREGLDHTPPS
jgi:phosphate transport system protein